MMRVTNILILTTAVLLSGLLPAVPTPEAAATSEVTTVAQPPARGGVEWVKVSFEKAENEILGLVKKDLPDLERKTQQTALFEVRVEGPLPADFSQTFRSKLERVLLMGETLKVKDCPSCEQSRLVRDANGELRYESQNEDPERAARIAQSLGVETLTYATVTYTQEDLRLNLKLVDVQKKDVLWSRDYSTAEYLSERESRFRLDPDRPGEIVREGDALSHVMLGEIAFTMVLAPGAILLPTIDRGRGSQRVFYPSVDLLMGERFNRGYNRFGFILSGAFQLGDGGQESQGLGFLARAGTNFRHTFNPYNVTSARYSIVGEAGVAIGEGVTTPYVGLGTEVGMMRRFSVTAMPVYFFPADVNPEVMVDDNGRVAMARGPNDGRFGGLGLVLKGNINW